MPGRVNDKYSEGCNYLLKNHKAAIVESADDIIKMLNWEETAVPKKYRRRSLLSFQVKKSYSLIFYG